METKTYLELETIGIVGMYRNDDKLFVVIKGGQVWMYDPEHCDFMYYESLM